MEDHVKCEQEPLIKQIMNSVSRMEQNQVEIISTMKQVAEQSAHIQHNTNDIAILKKDLNVLFERMRVMDMIVGKDGLALKPIMQEVVEAEMERRMEQVEKSIDAIERMIILFGNPYFRTFLFAVIFMIAMGTLCDIMYHYSVLKAVAGFFGKQLP